MQVVVVVVVAVVVVVVGVGVGVGVVGVGDVKDWHWKSFQFTNTARVYGVQALHCTALRRKFKGSC